MKLEEWLWIIFMFGWIISSTVELVDFSFQMGDKNSIIIEKVKKEEPKKEEPKSNDIKADW